jgi:hypothetical protein
MMEYRSLDPFDGFDAAPLGHFKELVVPVCQINDVPPLLL